MQDDRPASIPPYWTRFGSFFRYPLNGGPLLAWAGFGLLTGLCALLPLGRILQGFITISLLRYGYMILERTARGYLDDDMVYFEPTHDKYLPYKQLLVIAVGVILAGIAERVAGPNVGSLVLVLFAILLPANAMILAITNDLGESMSPPHLCALMRAIGMPYLGLCGCLLLLSLGSSGLLSLLLPRLPKALAFVAFGAIGAYFIIVVFRLMGYALYQYHRLIGMTVQVEFEQQAAAPSADPAVRLAEALREGRQDEAIAIARRELAGKSEDFPANQRLHRLLAAIPGREAELVEHAQNWLPVLTRTGRQEEAVALLETIWQYQPDYRPAASWILPLAHACVDHRRPDAATRLIQGFDRQYPGHAHIPDIYLLGARLLIEQRRDEAQARRIVAAIAQHFPNTPAAAEAARLNALLDRLAASGKS